MTATQAQSDDIARVILWCVPRTCSTAFLKCMTYVPDSQVWYEPYRHPYRVFDSYRKSLNNGMEEGSPMVNITDIPEHLLPKGLYYKEMHDLYMYVKEHFEPNPVIIDTDDLLADPGRVLKAYCQEVGIPYTDDLLQWKPGRECMDQLWMIAKGEILSNDIGGFHSATFMSTGFNKSTPLPDRSQLSEDVLVCSDQSMEYYNEMHENRLKV
ncbi:uncharacterized protein [Amphiura filiformis]|uniref:uncharacterized protein n=1 Tax=Amphiura filiformis TaxID=82378 RepID=UPI003B20EB5E